MPEIQVQNLVEVSLELRSTIGYAAYHNHIPAMNRLILHNPSEALKTGIQITISGSALRQDHVLRLESLQPGETRTFATVDLPFSPEYLAQLAEAEQSILTVSVTVQDGEAIQNTYPIEIQAYDQWAGIRSIPELLAAFCTPNHPDIDRLLSRSGEILGLSGQERALTGYQTGNREDVWYQISAVYSAIRGEKLIYSAPPASFGTDGQKIRLADRILSGRIATCLDLTMLFASCLEQAGLHPVILMKQGHSWVGCWLVDNTLPSALTDDGQSIRKRVQNGEILVFETTGVATEPQMSLAAAIEHGLSHLDEDREFLFGLDIRQARSEQILPLPSRWEATQSAPSTAPAPQIEPVPDLPPLGEQFDDFTPPAAGLSMSEARLSHWKSKLLDLTARNRLLNFKETRAMVPLWVPDSGDVEDALADGQAWKFRSIYEFIPEADPRSAAIAIARTGVNPYEALAKEVMGRRELLSPLGSQDLGARLVHIFRTGRIGQEEGGANTLFLAIGFLYWNDGPGAKTQSAPIVLIPVTLSRRSTRSGFEITRHDDDTVVNPTLLQLLRDRYQLTLNHLDPLPADRHGVDVSKIIQIFRLAITHIPKWEVREEIYLGIFSYTKYLMWKDLEDRTEDLRQNRVVSRLIDAESSAGPTVVPETFAEQGDLDRRHSPGELFAPLNADSSQLNAISRAAEGYDLVLEGPPGTGKSQTITNLIAHFLGSGQSVLFVSEKMAALEVVSARLNTIGLGPFCLQLHSAKAKKTAVLAQLDEALSAAAEQSEEEWLNQALRLAALRDDLNAWVEVLHRRHPNGLSVRDAIGILSRYSNSEPARISWERPDAHTAEDMNGQRELVRTIAAVLEDLGPLSGHPLTGLSHREWSNAWEDQFNDALDQMERSVDAIIQSSRTITKLQGVRDALENELSFQLLDGVCAELIAAQTMPPKILHQPDQDLVPMFQEWRRHGRDHAIAWEQLESRFRPEVSSLNGEGLHSEWMAAKGKSFFPRWLARRKITSQLKPYCTQPVAEHSLEQVLTALARLNQEEARLKSYDDRAFALLGDLYRGAGTDWAEIERIENWIERFNRAVLQWGRSANPDAPTVVNSRVQEWIRVEGKDGVESLAPLLARYRECWRDYQSARETLAGLSLASPDGLPEDFGELRSTVQQWRSGREYWRMWCRWMILRNDAVHIGLEALVDQLEQGRVAPANLEDQWDYSYCYWWFRVVMDREPGLRSFSRSDHGRKISDFQEADQAFREMTAQHIVAKLAAKVPKGDRVSRFTPEIRLLRRELAKKRAHWPVRKLIRELPNLLPTLKPCLLMSPLSVAQYLDTGARFDVVIFDEASQIPVWEAVGAIARGKQLIVVGDPKQLPPTSFFNTQDHEDETADDNLVQDLESILDECLGSSLPTLRLQWHYRSRYESLIAFSNHRYYDSRLVTFPSPVTRDTAVSLKWLEGVYDRGGTRTNAEEAQAVVEAIASHFMEWGDGAPTLGVVTFNLPQQHLIEELLERKLQSSPELEERISRSPERLFVKNLENVQGDERDLIFFSITYGRDQNGRIALNMGPLNKDGGHRRLNVAITRARLGVKIFSTIRSEEIDLSRSRAQGIVDLKDYLHYAEHGTLNHRGTQTGSSSRIHPIEDGIVSRLEERGWSCRRTIGLSHHRVDVGVVDPENPSRFLLGIESDGAGYRGLPSARDRDSLHQEVLTGLGWDLERVWSVDWLSNPGREIQRIEDRLHELLLPKESDQSV